jgi:hypothetical protein
MPFSEIGNRSFRLCGAAAGLLILFQIAAQPAYAGECHWFSVDKVVKECTTIGGSGRLFKPVANSLALECGPAKCRNAREQKGCAEYGVGPHSSAPKGWAKDSKSEVAWAIAANGWGSTGTTGDPGPGSPYDACLQVMKEAAKKLGFAMK